MQYIALMLSTLMEELYPNLLAFYFCLFVILFMWIMGYVALRMYPPPEEKPGQIEYTIIALRNYSLVNIALSVITLTLRAVAEISFL